MFPDKFGSGTSIVMSLICFSPCFLILAVNRVAFQDNSSTVMVGVKILNALVICRHFFFIVVGFFLWNSNKKCKDNS